MRAALVHQFGSPDGLAVSERPRPIAGTGEVVSEHLREAMRTLTGGCGADVVLVVGFASGTIPRIPAEHLLLKNISVLGIGFGRILLAEPAEAHRVIDDRLAPVEHLLLGAQPFPGHQGCAAPAPCARA